MAERPANLPPAPDRGPGTWRCRSAPLLRARAPRTNAERDFPELFANAVEHPPPRELTRCTYVDETVEDGYLWTQVCADPYSRAEVGVSSHRDYFMSHATHDMLFRFDCLDEVRDALSGLPVGRHLVPPGILRAAMATSDWLDVWQPVGVRDFGDLVRDLRLVPDDLLDPDGSSPATHCVYGPCLLPAEDRRRGFWLCVHHARLLDGWDFLLDSFNVGLG